MSDMIWLTANKRKIQVRDMSTEHLRNTITMMERELLPNLQHYLSPERNAIPIYHVMKAELAEREQKESTSVSEKIEQQRAAYVQGVMSHYIGNDFSVRVIAKARAVFAAKELYPIEITEPRVITRNGFDYRVAADGQTLECRLGGSWGPSGFHDVATIKALAELVNNPTVTRKVAE